MNYAKQSIKSSDGELMIFIGTVDDEVVMEKAVENHIAKKLKKGASIIEKDGSSYWIIDSEMMDLSKEGSAMYTWSADGERVKHNRWRYDKDADGNVTQTFLKHVWKAA